MPSSNFLLVLAVATLLLYAHLSTSDRPKPSQPQRARTHKSLPKKPQEPATVLDQPGVSWLHERSYPVNQPTSQTPLGGRLRTNSSSTLRKAIVMRLTEGQSASWLEEELSSWEHYLYSADAMPDTLGLIANKGNEALAYLTFIVQNYDHLPDVTLFMHPHRDVESHGWHIDSEDLSNVWYAKKLRLEHVQEVGYSNLRCTLYPGCPVIFQTNWERTEDDFRKKYDEAYKRSWPHLFPGVPTPEYIAAPCCAQFAVARHQILERPRSDYVRYLMWLLETTDDDNVSGTIMEYSWHLIFGRGPEYCPDEVQCSCSLYGEYCDEVEEA